MTETGRQGPAVHLALPEAPGRRTSHICSWKNRRSFSISSAISAPLISVRIIPCSLACSFFSFSILVLRVEKVRLNQDTSRLESAPLWSRHPPWTQMLAEPFQNRTASNSLERKKRFVINMSTLALSVEYRPKKGFQSNLTRTVPIITEENK